MIEISNDTESFDGLTYGVKEEYFYHPSEKIIGKRSNISASGYAYPLKGDAEYRGWYRVSSGPDNGKRYWAPAWSKFNGARPSGPHKGSDLFSYQRETLIAISRGAMEFRSPKPNWGNHIYLYFKLNNVNHIAVYAHLDSSSAFSGVKQVGKGDEIGMAGCSGNAGDNGKCWRSNYCNGSLAIEDHLHLELLRLNPDGSVDAKLDPVATFGWNVKYANDTSSGICKTKYQLA